ncbi:MAG: DUF433 domain-containing protein [Bacteroidota bacterium]
MTLIYLFSTLWNHFLDRITFNPEQCGGKSCIGGMRIRVTNVLDLMANGLSKEEVLAELPDLKNEDSIAVLPFASKKLNYPILKG